MKTWLALLLTCLLVACHDDASPGTTLVLTVHSDLSVPAELDRISVSVVGQEVETDPEADLRSQPLPRTLTLVHDSGPLGPVDITVRGWLGTQVVVEKTLVAWFVEGRHEPLDVELERACANVTCGDGFTCESGTCVPTSMMDGGSEPDATVQDASIRDARVSDASDASPRDAAFEDASAEDASLHDAGYDAATRDGGTTNSGLPPTCAISLPTSLDTYRVDSTFAANGICNDPETGTLTTGLSWTSSVEGPLGTSASLQVTLHRVGMQRLTLCAADPRDAAVTGCANVDIVVALVAQPTAVITSIAQNATVASPYRASTPIVFTGTGSGAGLTFGWSDNVQGLLGSTTSVSLASPRVGRHVITLTVRDRNNVQATATRPYFVVAEGESNLFSPYPSVNTTLDAAGDPGVTMIASDPASRAYVPNSSGVLYRLDGTQLSSPAVAAVGQPPLPGVVQGAFLAVDKNLTYLGTDQGLTVCSYAMARGVVEPCTVYGRGVSLQSLNVLSVLRMSVPGMGMGTPTDVLLEGTDSGVFIPDNVIGSTRGTVLLRGRRVSDLLQVGNQAALATDNGLFLLAPLAQTTVRYSTADGLLSNALTRLALGTDGSIWIGTTSGLSHFEPAAHKWTNFTTANGLAGNRVNDVAVQRSTMDTPPRDIVWIASSGGVTRLDTLDNSAQRFTTTDGLPTNEVLSIEVLANGVKLFGTSKGIAHYLGE